HSAPRRAASRAKLLHFLPGRLVVAGYAGGWRRKTLIQSTLAIQPTGTPTAPSCGSQYLEFEGLGDLIMVRSSHITKGAKVRARAARGFTLLELVIVVAIGLILAGLATPVIVNTLRVYKMRSAVTSTTSVISNARYQAIFHGCKTQVVFTAATNTYQISSQQPPYGGQACLAAYGAIT